ncbi:MAG: DUF424 family protein [Candidatus Geothermarchaeales archaeon]
MASKKGLGGFPPEADEDIKFFVQLRRIREKVFLFVYDEELIEEEASIFHNKKIDIVCQGEQLIALFDESDSINLYGRRAIDKAIEAGYIHPEGVREIKGVPCAICIKV